MSFVTYKDRAGQAWLVDTDGIKALIRSYARAKAVINRSHLASDPQQTGPLGILFPLTIVTVQTNFAGIQNEVNTQANAILKHVLPQIAQSGKLALQTLVSYRRQTLAANAQLRNMQVTASAKTNQALSAFDSRTGTAIAVTKGVRDFSAEFLLIGATLLSGGTAVAAVGGASLLKGAFTVQDKKMAGASTSDAVGAGAVEASFDFAVGVISVGSTPVIREAVQTKSLASGVAAGTLVLLGAGIDGTSEFVKATMDGKSAQQALVTAGSRAALDTLLAGSSIGLDAVFATPAFAGWSFPVTVTRSSAEVQSVTGMGLNSGASYGADWIVNSLGGGESVAGAASHNSLACTYLAQPTSDLVYVEQHAMRPAPR